MDSLSCYKIASIKEILSCDMMFSSINLHHVFHQPFGPECDISIMTRVTIILWWNDALTRCDFRLSKEASATGTSLTKFVICGIIHSVYSL